LNWGIAEIGIMRRLVEILVTTYTLSPESSYKEGCALPTKDYQVGNGNLSELYTAIITNIFGCWPDFEFLKNASIEGMTE
jgi:hypothetical protein